MLKTFLNLISLLFLFNLAGCSTSIKPPLTTPPPTKHQLIQHITNSTVAILEQEEFDSWRPVCTGVWINDTTFITAQHCVEDDNKKEKIDGRYIYYSIYNEIRGLGVKPKAIHPAMVVAHDEIHDLAMVRVAGKYPAHENIVLGSVPDVGDNIHMVGHLQGLYYSYTTGVVSAYRLSVPEIISTLGPFIQCSMPLWHGNSGGGGFNDIGELVGIADFIAPAPHVGFLISVSTVKQFVIDHK